VPNRGATAEMRIWLPHLGQSGGRVSFDIDESLDRRGDECGVMQNRA